MTATTFLDAVNELLSSVGQLPVNSLEIGTPTSQIAETFLRKYSRALLAEGWWWNTEKRTLSPDPVTNEIAVPADTLQVKVDQRRYYPKRLTKRGSKLFDLDTGAFEIDQDIELALVRELPWEELPEPARSYIAIRATRVFQDRIQGDQAAHRYTQEEEYMARGELMRDAIETEQPNYFANSEAYRTLHRRT